MYMSDKVIDPTNYDSPFTHKGVNLYAPTSSAYPKEL